MKVLEICLLDREDLSEQLLPEQPEQKTDYKQRFSSVSAWGYNKTENVFI